MTNQNYFLLKLIVASKMREKILEVIIKSQIVDGMIDRLKFGLKFGYAYFIGRVFTHSLSGYLHPAHSLTKKLHFLSTFLSGSALWNLFTKPFTLKTVSYVNHRYGWGLVNHIFSQVVTIAVFLERELYRRNMLNSESSSAAIRFAWLFILKNLRNKGLFFDDFYGHGPK